MPKMTAYEIGRRCGPVIYLADLGNQRVRVRWLCCQAEEDIGRHHLHNLNCRDPGSTCRTCYKQSDRRQHTLQGVRPVYGAAAVLNADAALWPGLLSRPAPTLLHRDLWGMPSCHSLP